MAADVISYVNPTFLYRYRSLKPELKSGKVVRNRLEEELEAIEKGFVYCSTYKAMNDPMEGLYKPSLRTRKKPGWPDLASLINDEKLRLGIACFSETWDHELMWAHYADGFRGICVAFRLNDLIKGLPDDLALTRISYGDRPQSFDDKKAQKPMRARVILSQKSVKWVYEREWRLFAQEGKAHYRNGAVAHVYLGTRMSSSDREVVTKRLKAADIEVRRTIVDGYSVIRKPKKKKA